jgi:hypothetical protein
MGRRQILSWQEGHGAFPYGHSQVTSVSFISITSANAMPEGAFVTINLHFLKRLTQLRLALGS